MCPRVRLEAERRVAIERNNPLPGNQRRLPLVPAEPRFSPCDGGGHEHRCRKAEAFEHTRRMLGHVEVAIVEGNPDERRVVAAPGKVTPEIRNVDPPKAMFGEEGHLHLEGPRRNRQDVLLVGDAVIEEDPDATC